MGEIGISRDVVTLKLGGDTLLVAESYEIQFGLLTQPASFALRLGRGDAVKSLIQKYPPRTPFQLFIDGNLVMSGTTDGYTASDGNGGASEFTIRGRDSMGPLVNAYVKGERRFADVTYVELTRAALDATVGAGKYKLIPSNDANRKAITRSPTPADTAPEDVPTTGLTGDIAEDFITGAKAVAGGAVTALTPRQSTAMRTSGWLQATGTAAQTAERTLETGAGVVFDALLGGTDVNGLNTNVDSPAQPTIQAKLGQKVYEGLLKPYLDRGGLFLWATSVPNTFVLSDPNLAQKPTYRLIRQRGATINQVNVLSAQYKNETTSRYSRCEVHFRRGGGAETRTRAFGLFVDREMTTAGFDQPLIFKEDKCKSLIQADFLAKRKICETIRAGWILEYTVAGHSTPWVGGPGYVVWFFDTIVDVRDDEYGINGSFFIESVSMRGNPQKTTTLRLMRLDAAVFGDIDGA